MSKFINIVRVRVKKDSKKDYLKKIKNVANIEGLISSKHIETGPNTYCMVEEWITKEALMKARKIIEILVECFSSILVSVSTNSKFSFLATILPKVDLPTPIIPNKTRFFFTVI